MSPRRFRRPGVHHTVCAMASGLLSTRTPHAAEVPIESPTVRGWALGLRLRQRRAELGLTITAAARATGVTSTYLSGIEAGSVRFPGDRLAQLITLYNLDDEDASELEELRLAATRRAWWHRYSQLFPAEFLRFLGYEAGATHVRCYDNELLHGLLQTEAYARAVIRGGSTYVRLTEVDRRVTARMARQTRLTYANPLKLTMLVGEGVLRQQVGGPEVMREQLDHLTRLVDERPGQIQIRVMPFTAGAYPALGGPFQILTFSSRLPDLVWQEVLNSSDIIDQSARVTDYVVTFAETMECALNSDDSLDLIRQIAKEMT